MSEDQTPVSVVLRQPPSRGSVVDLPGHQQELGGEDTEAGDDQEGDGEDAEVRVIGLRSARVVEHDAKVREMVTETYGHTGVTVLHTHTTSGP